MWVSYYKQKNVLLLEIRFPAHVGDLSGSLSFCCWGARDLGIFEDAIVLAFGGEQYLLGAEYLIPDSLKASLCLPVKNQRNTLTVLLQR